MSERWRTALTIAGSDSGGGAGIQADLKTFLDHSVFGMSVITAVTAQNTRGVTRIDALPAEAVRAQLEAVFDDLPVDAVKIGMLADAGIAAAVADVLEGLRDRPPIVLDTVMIATTGARLLAPEAEAVIRERLMPLAAVATPNRPEARVLARSDDVLSWAAGAPCPVLITGGDDEGDQVVDELVRGRERERWEGPRVPGHGFHGTGCTLSSAIAARLAVGEDLVTACELGVRYVRALVAGSARRDLGGGVRVLGHGLV